MNTLDRVLSLLSLGPFELVSYGIAPNPNGFCFEIDHNTEHQKPMIDRYANELGELLGKLDRYETIALKQHTFGE